MDGNAPALIAGAFPMAVLLETEATHTRFDVSCAPTNPPAGRVQMALARCRASSVTLATLLGTGRGRAGGP